MRFQSITMACFARRKSVALAAALLWPAVVALAADSIPVADRQRMWLMEISLKASPLAFENPALTPLIRNFSISRAELSYSRNHQSVAVIAQKGSGSAFGAIGADAYIKSGKSTFTGSAEYLTGVDFDMQWNESGSIDKVYPYVIADAVGGNMRRERYSFAGSYSHESNRILWGVEGGYSANLYYRKVDPRPKTIEGLLHLKGGIAYRLWSDYFAGGALFFEKFRQSTDIKFVSELGESKLYHLTGLGTFYSRFAGVGSNVYSDMYSYGAELNLYPHGGGGFFLSGKYMRSSMNHVIVDLNRLPMANLHHNEWHAEAGYLSSKTPLRWSVSAEFNRSTRRGYEGIFGDPQSGSYPQIGKILSYARNYYDASVYAQIAGNVGKFSLSLIPSGGFSHEHSEYLEPERRRTVGNYFFAGKASALYSAGKCLINLQFNFMRRLNYKKAQILSPLPSEDEETLLLQQTVEADFKGLSSSLTALGLSAGFSLPLNNSYAFGLNAGYCHQNYGFGSIANNFSSSISFIF